MISGILLLIVVFPIWCIVATCDRPTGGINDYNKYFCTHSGMSKRQIRKNIRNGIW